jgi:uncharacterized glyoxalase superfamily protein PhnB
VVPDATGQWTVESIYATPGYSYGTFLVITTNTEWRQSECAEFGLGDVQGTANDRVLIELEVADVEREYARLKDLQVEWVQELTTQPWSHRAFYIRDPDGNVLNFHMVVEEERR